MVEIQDRDRVAVHADVAETVDALLRGDALAPELRWRDEGGVHRSQSRPRPGPRSRLPGERFGGLVGPGSMGWATEPGWRPEVRRAPQAGAEDAAGRAAGVARGRGRASDRTSAAAGAWASEPSRRSLSRTPVFRSGVIADRGPLERGSALLDERARDVREHERQAGWRASAARTLGQLALAEAPSPAASSPALAAGTDDSAGDDDETWVGTAAPAWDDEAGPDPDEDASLIRIEALPAISPLEKLSVLGYGVSRKRLEQAIRDLQLPVVVVREPDEADLVITLRNMYKQKSPVIREAEARGIPIYVLKSNTVVQMQAVLTSIYALELDPQQLAMRELEEAIGLVRAEAKPVELSPQNAFVRRLQHRAAEEANLVSRSRGREPFRRVRVYPEKARAWQ